jgi:hypothetical protein
VQSSAPGLCEASCGRGLLVHDEQVDRFRAVFGAGTGVEPGRFEPRVADEFGGDDQVGVPADKRGGERVSEHVGGDVLVEPVASGDAGDDVVGACLIVVTTSTRRASASTGSNRRYDRG